MLLSQFTKSLCWYELEKKEPNLAELDQESRRMFKIRYSKLKKPKKNKQKSSFTDPEPVKTPSESSQDPTRILYLLPEEMLSGRYILMQRNPVLQ